MARAKGMLNLSGNLEVNAQAPLDARTIVPTEADLTVANNFPYPYVGLEVYVTGTGKKFRLVNLDTTQSSSWQEISEGGGGGGGSNAIIYDETGDPHQIGIYVDSGGVEKPIYRRLSEQDIREPYVITDGTPFASSTDMDQNVNNAFDNNANTVWTTARGDTSPCYVGKMNMTPSIFTKAVVNIKDRGTREVWVVQGSNDGENWVDISETINPTGIGEWTLNPLQSYDFTPYKHLRIHFSKGLLPTTTMGTYTTIREVKFYTNAFVYSKMIDYKKTYDNAYHMYDYVV